MILTSSFYMLLACILILRITLDFMPVKLSIAIYIGVWSYSYFTNGILGLLMFLTPIAAVVIATMILFLGSAFGAMYIKILKCIRELWK